MPHVPANRKGLLPVVLVAMFMAQFDLYVVNVALPVLQRELAASEASLELIVGGYAFTYAAALITGGRLGDHFGHRSVFLVGMALFGGTSLMCGIAQSVQQLVLFRLLQGVTAAILVPQVLALITRGFPGPERARALAWFGVTMGVGAVAGQVVGGMLLDFDVFGLGWRAIFLVNVPVAVVSVALGICMLPGREAKSSISFDLLGAVGISVALALILIPLVSGRSHGWAPWTWICLAMSIPVLLSTLERERRVEKKGGNPVIPLVLFGSRAFNLGLGASIALFAGFFSVVFALTLVLQNGLDLTPMMAGLTFAPLGTAFAVTSILSRKHIARYGARVIACGTVIVLVGLLALVSVLYLVDTSLTAPVLIGPMVLIGLGNGIAIPALIGVVLSKSEPQQAGALAGVLTTAQQFASALGIAGVGTVFFAVLGTTDATSIGSYPDALAAAALCSVLLSIIGALLVFGLVRLDRPPSGSEVSGPV